MKRTEHRGEQWIFPFVEYSPENSDKKLPLVIQLHGAGERGNGSEEELSKVDIHGFSNIMEGNEYECIFIMPQCPKTTFWAARVESIHKFIDSIIEKYNVDEDRVYLTGLSMGGFGTWNVAMDSPKRFAAIAPVCGGGMAWNMGVLKMPIWMFHGENDGVVSPTNSDEIAKKLESIGADYKYTKVPDVAHDVWKVAYTKELLEWLLSKKR